jgi:hypothetical protein
LMFERAAHSRGRSFQFKSSLLEDLCPAPDSVIGISSI